MLSLDFALTDRKRRKEQTDEEKRLSLKPRQERIKEGLQSRERIPGSDAKDGDPTVPLNLIRRGSLKFSMSPEARLQEDKEADGGQVG